jgi:flavorubredoxin
MASKKVCEIWVRLVEKFNPRMIAPQHGAIFKGENVKRFLDWFRNLESGIDIAESIYGV